LEVPRFPSIPRIDSFKGEMFHSVKWDTWVDLRGKRVAVVGNGAFGLARRRAVVFRLSDPHHLQRVVKAWLDVEQWIHDILSGWCVEQACENLSQDHVDAFYDIIPLLIIAAKAAPFADALIANDHERSRDAFRVSPILLAHRDRSLVHETQQMQPVHQCRRRICYPCRKTHRSRVGVAYPR
ncbi:hypothetical protein DFH09DRAFT_926584, partial [Mycena vulgaris]